MQGKLLAIAACMFVGVCSAQFAPASSADQRYENLKMAVNIGELTVSPSADDDRSTAAMAAVGWLEGVYAVLEMNGAAKYQMAICPPPDISRMAIARVYLNYMDANPKSHGMPDVAVATLSAIKAFPCSKSE